MKKIISGFMCAVLFFCSPVRSFSADNADTEAVIGAAADYLYETVQNPRFGSIGGEWCILGLAESGRDIPEGYFENYYRSVEALVADSGGILHKRKYTEYSRLITALTAIGKNPADVSGYNLLVPLGDYEKTVWQGINGAVWALIALDSGNYEIPRNESANIQATREAYVRYILEKQTSDGGWAMSGGSADADMTAMALQALSRYQNDENVKAATEKALLRMSEMQSESGGFSNGETETSESSAQMLIALCALGIPVSDSRFVKNGNTVLDNLLAYSENGSCFRHTKDGEVNQMATEQCFCALVALKRFAEGKGGLYNTADMTADAAADGTDKARAEFIGSLGAMLMPSGFFRERLK